MQYYRDCHSSGQEERYVIAMETVDGLCEFFKTPTHYCDVETALDRAEVLSKRYNRKFVVFQAMFRIVQEPVAGTRTVIEVLP